MSLQERTLVIKNFDPEKTTTKLLKELCMQAGPVRNVVVKPDHAFVEYDDMESVGYSKALLDGIQMFGQTLVMETKLKGPIYHKYSKLLNDYIDYDRRRQEQARRDHMAIIEQERLQQQAMSSHHRFAHQNTLPNMHLQNNQIMLAQQSICNPLMHPHYQLHNVIQHQILAPPPFNEFRPHVPRNLANRPWSDKDRWNRRQ